MRGHQADGMDMLPDGVSARRACVFFICHTLCADVSDAQLSMMQMVTRPMPLSMFLWPPSKTRMHAAALYALYLGCAA